MKSTRLSRTRAIRSNTVTNASASAGIVRRQTRRTSFLQRSTTIVGWGLMSPAMTLLLLMTVVPTLHLFYYAFRHEDLLGPNSYWVGFGNFTRILADRNIWSDALSTVQFVVLAVAIELL